MIKITEQKKYEIGCFGIYLYDVNASINIFFKDRPARYVLRDAGFFVKEKDQEISEAIRFYPKKDNQGTIRYDALLEDICEIYGFGSENMPLEYCPKNPAENKILFPKRQINTYSKMPIANLEHAIYINID